jgi:dihydroorotase/N-acyl-D-amino-acid deacylase
MARRSLVFGRRRAGLLSAVLLRVVLLPVGLLAGGFAVSARRSHDAPAAALQPVDLLLVGGTVVDGTGTPGRRADVAIAGNRIVAVGENLSRHGARRVLDVSGQVVAPGFIDLHAHLEPLLQLSLMESAMRQGVTLALGGPDGGSPLPLGPYLDSVRAVKPGINVAYLVGHNDVRRAVMNMDARAPSAAELMRMKRLVAEAMGHGAFGLSTGLLYLPGTYSNVEEVIALAQVASDSGGIYTSHLRKEGIGLLDGVSEALEIGRRARIPVVLTHHKAVGQQMWGQSTVTLAMVDSARRAGTDVMIDQYPYTATHTGIGVLVPSWAMAGGTGEFRKRLAVPALRDSIKADIVFNILNDRGGGDLARVQFSRVPWDRTLEGQTLEDWAARRNLAPTPEHGAELVLEAMLNGGGNAIYHVLDEGDVRRIMTHPFTMIASDGRLSQPGDGHPHPRAYGTFPRVLGRYVREQKLLSLEQAVHKMTQMPAQRLGLSDRGVLRAGAMADVVVFDAGTVVDQSTFTAPHQYPKGIGTVIVNGVVAVENGTPTGARAGTVVTRPRPRPRPRSRP